MNVYSITELIVTCAFWVFVTVWTVFFAVELPIRIIGTVCICVALLSSMIGKEWILEKFVRMK